MGAGNFVSSNGNRVNVGNFDSNGLNVNNWTDDNCNDNVGVVASRNFFLYLLTKASSLREDVCVTAL